jgi:hypothetical protein
MTKDEARRIAVNNREAAGAGAALIRRGGLGQRNRHSGEAIGAAGQVLAYARAGGSAAGRRSA